MSEQQTFTKEDVMAQLKDAIELQELQTKLQKLRTELVLNRYDEVRYTIAFEDLTKKPEGPNTNESTTDNKEAQA